MLYIGDWVAWGQDPEKYVAMFRQMATIVRNATGINPANSTNGTEALNGLPSALNATKIHEGLDANDTSVVAGRAYTAIVWAPAPAQRYPFNNTAAKSSPHYNSTRWRLMDTNQDGVIDRDVSLDLWNLQHVVCKLMNLCSRMTRICPTTQGMSMLTGLVLRHSITARLSN